MKMTTVFFFVDKTECGCKMTNVGFGSSQIDPWDNLLSELYNELLEDEIQAVLQYYRSHDYRHDGLEEMEVDMTESIFCDIVNRGLYT